MDQCTDGELAAKGLFGTQFIESWLQDLQNGKWNERFETRTPPTVLYRLIRGREWCAGDTSVRVVGYQE